MAIAADLFWAKEILENKTKLNQTASCTYRKGKGSREKGLKVLSFPCDVMVDKLVG